MAGLVRLRSVLGRMTSSAVVRARTFQQTVRRQVGTSNTQKSETAKIAVEECKPKKAWVSYGFSFESQEVDNHFMHLTFFVSISLLLTTGSYIYAYLPDYRLRDWAQREGYLELRRRESLGLPPIDRNLVDPSKVILPTDEELGDAEIII